MPALSELARAARDGLAFLRAQPGVREVEVFVSENRTLLTRLNYTSHIPCNGVEEPKSAEMYGVGIQVAFDSPEGVLIGFGSEPSDLSTAGINWDDVGVLSATGINWLSVNELTTAGVNWNDIDVLSDAGINWADMEVHVPRSPLAKITAC